MFSKLLNFLDVEDMAIRKIVYECIAHTILENNLAYRHDPLDFTYQINNPDQLDVNYIIKFMRLSHAQLCQEGMKNYE